MSISTLLSFTPPPIPVSSKENRLGLSRQVTLMPPTSSKVSTVVIRAQTYEGEPKRDQTPFVKPFDPLRMNPIFETSRSEPDTWKMAEREDSIEMWLKMPGVAVMDIYMYVKDNKLYIQERYDITPFRRMMIQPFESIPLPPDCNKEEIVAKLGNGILYIYVPKYRPDVVYNIPVENVSW